MSEAYYIAREERIEGPFSLGQLKALHAEGRVAAEAMVSSDKSDWRSLDEVVRLKQRSASAVSALAVVAIVLGLASFVYFTVFFETTAPSDVGRVHNTGLQQEQLIGVLASLCTILCGTIWQATAAILARLK